MTTESNERAILEKFITDNPPLEELEAKISSFNIFEAVGMIRQEIKHSNFLQFLLNPSEKHQLGDLFLKKLLMHIRHSAEEETSLDNLDVPNASFTDADVRREWKNTDLLIHSPGNDFVCTIENKVDSTEGFDQLKTYETVINKEFPGAKKLFVFLTRDGIAASCANWLSLSYGAIADIIEQICDERGKSMTPDIQISMRHYVDLIRRHIMSESDIADLCRKIYKEHRQAIDLIYEHRPDLRSDIEEFICQLIQESASTEKLELDSINKRWIRVAPTEWDELAFQKTCTGWTLNQRILLFEFWNEPQSLQLRLVIGPGDIPTKQDLYQTLNELNIPGIKKCKLKDSNWTQAYITQILSASDYEDGDLEDLQEKIKAFWKNYITGDMEIIREAIYSSFEKKLL